jgi:hypothetical protein
MCYFPSVEDPLDVKLDQWFDVNMFGGSCGYMVLLTTKEFVPASSRYVLTLDYTFEEGETTYEAVED